MRALIDQLKAERTLPKENLVALIKHYDQPLMDYLFSHAVALRRQYYGNKIFIRGLIEVSNYCKNDCYYCGIRRGNSQVERYRLTKAEVVACADEGYRLGFRTIVLQGGEDNYLTDERLEEVIKAVKESHPDCAVTLSVGEREANSYKRLKEAGADRYLLRFETSSPEHYGRLHPRELTIETRLEKVAQLRETGYTVGTGIMVGSPYQTHENIADDLILISRLKPEMVGLGPFVAHHNTRFAGYPNGSLKDTLFILGLVRLMLPSVLLPATTALSTIDPKGRQLGVEASCNVVMPNLSPADVRRKYMLYDGKATTGGEAAETLSQLKAEMAEIGYQVVEERGDFVPA